MASKKGAKKKPVWRRKGETSSEPAGITTELSSVDSSADLQILVASLELDEEEEPVRERLPKTGIISAKKKKKSKSKKKRKSKSKKKKIPAIVTVDEKEEDDSVPGDRGSSSMKKKTTKKKKSKKTKSKKTKRLSSTMKKIKKAIMNVADRGGYEICDIEDEIREELNDWSIEIEVEKHASFAFRITVGNESTAVAIRLDRLISVVKRAGRSSHYFKEIKTLLSMRRRESSTEEGIDSKKMRVKASFICSECGHSWTSFQAYLNRETEEPWQGKTQLCKECMNHGDMEWYMRLSDCEVSDDEVIKPRRRHRTDLCEWCGLFKLKGDHSKMKDFISPSYARFLIENGPGKWDVNEEYECGEWELNPDQDGFTMPVFVKGTGLINPVVNLQFKLFWNVL